MTKTVDLEAMLSGSAPVLTQDLLSRELLKSIPNAIHHVLAQCLEALKEVWVQKNSVNSESEKVEKKRDRFPEKLKLT